MLISKFNDLHGNQIRAREIQKHRDNFFIIEQWCPQAEKYSRLHGTLLGCRSHFDGPEVPDKVVDAANEYSRNGYCRPVVLVLNDRHGNGYYDASTAELFGLACLEILENRKDYFAYDDRDEPKEPNVPRDAHEDTPDLHKAVREMWARYDYIIKVHKEDEHIKRSYEIVMRDRLYFDAFHLLQFRPLNNVDLELETMIIGKFKQATSETANV